MENLSEQHVLLVKTSSLGDVIHAMPAVTEAAQHGCKITWVVEESFAQAAGLHPHVATVIPVAVRRWRKQRDSAARSEVRAFLRDLRSQRYDVVLDSQGLIKSALIGYFARGKRMGFSHTVAREPWSAFFYEKRFSIPQGQHAIARQRQLFAAALGYELQEQLPIGLPQANNRTQEVVLLHGTTWETKHYPEAMWVGLARQVAQEGYEVVLTWGNDAERERADRIANAADVNVTDKLPLQDLSKILGRAACVIGVDTGLSHLSAAMGTPTVGLYGPTSTELTGCLGRYGVSLSTDLACAPCVSQSCTAYRGDPQTWSDEVVTPPCFARLTPDRVWQAAHVQMQAANAAVLSGQD
ncbi:MAG: lipopolysaccharide heptosyltransferase I [Pseudomonadota bacterium]